MEFSEYLVRRILRDKLKMKLSKPCPLDYRRLVDAEELLERELMLVMRYLKEAKEFKKNK